MTVQYLTAADMAIIVGYGGANEAAVAGLNNIQAPGLERSTVQVQEFRNSFDRKFAGGASTNTITYSGNFVKGDDNGQTALLNYCKANTAFTDCRIYANYITSNTDSDFWTVDLANDTSAAFQVTKHSPGAADVNGVIPFSGEMVLNGRYAFFDTHYTASTIAAVDSNPDTFTDSANGFVTAGFTAGQVVLIESGDANDGVYAILATVAAGTLTLTAAGALTAVAAGSAVTIHAGF